MSSGISNSAIDLDTVAPELSDLSREIQPLLSEYLQIDTTNPPGDVSAAADWVEALLNAEGIETKRLGPTLDRANVVATIPGAGASPLLLTHHMDVVPAPSEGWTVDPFGGVIKDGYVWGRGSLDMKGFGLLSLLCAICLQRLGLPLRRSLRVVATADEEIGGAGGAKWLTENCFEEVSGEFLLTEGGSGNVRHNMTYYRVQTTEKGVSAVKLIARGRPGHASAPRGDNSIVRMARALARLGDYRAPALARDAGVKFLSAFPRDVLGLRDGRALESIDSDEIERLILRAEGRRRTNMLRNTFTPTMVGGGLGQNVIPAVCEAFVDCRSLPGTTGEELLAELTGVIDDGEIQLELVKASLGTSSPSDTELFTAIRQAVTAERPEAFVVPYQTSGGSDAKHFRTKGVVCYGMIPFEFEGESEPSRIHGFDERVSVENLERGLRILFRIVTSVCADLDS